MAPVVALKLNGIYQIRAVGRNAACSTNSEQSFTATGLRHCARRSHALRLSLQPRLTSTGLTATVPLPSVQPTCTPPPARKTA